MLSSGIVVGTVMNFVPGSENHAIAIRIHALIDLPCRAASLFMEACSPLLHLNKMAFVLRRRFGSFGRPRPRFTEQFWLI